MNWLGPAADVKVRQKIQKNPKRNKIKEETKKIKIPTCEIILMRGGGDPDLGDKSSVFPFFFFFWWYRNKIPDSGVWKDRKFQVGTFVMFLGVSTLNSTITSAPRSAASSESFLWKMRRRVRQPVFGS